MSAYVEELKLAELAIQRASILTKQVFREEAKGTISKDDRSPVTIGDYGAQALIIGAIRAKYPDDEIVGEEEANSIRQESELRSKVFKFVQQAKLNDRASEDFLGGAIQSEEEMLLAVDAGRSAGGKNGRIWVLDPIDGTKGFLRGGQYAVCLALMVDGDVKVGALACPNLPVSDSVAVNSGSFEETAGALFSAVKEHGAYGRALSNGCLEPRHQISMRSITEVTEAIFCESVESGHSSHGDMATIVGKLKINGPSVRMDSQAKYASIARGAGDIYLRLPVRKDYEEKIWDHAAGDLIVREAGGIVTDIQGKKLNFTLGRTLKDNKGVVAAPKAVHSRVLAAVKEVLKT